MSLVQAIRARGIVDRRSRGRFSRGESGRQDQHPPTRLAYVPMDVLWQLAEVTQNTPTPGQLVARMEDRSAFGSYSEALYVYLLPTLGQRGVPILLERLNEITAGSDGDYRAALIGKAFANLAKQESVQLKEAVDSLLKRSSRDLQNVALTVLSIAPCAEHLDRLWELHQQRRDALDDQADVSRFSNYQASFAALRTGIALVPGWLRDRILAADAEKESLSELGYLLNALEHPNAPAIWKDIGHVLMDKASVSKPRSLLYCIARFVDRDKLDFVTQNLSRPEHFAASAAFTALSVLDPLAAINRLVEFGDTARYLSRNNWLPVLLRAQPELTRKRIRELAETDPQGSRVIVESFLGTARSGGRGDSSFCVARAGE